MAVQIRGIATNVSGNTTSAVNKPAGVQAGDLLVLQVSIASSSGTLVITVPDGFELIPNATITSLANQIRLYAKTAGASEPADYTVTIDISTNRTLGMLALYSDASKNVEADVAGTQSSGSNVNRTWPSINPSKACLLGCFASIGANTDSTPDAAMDERWDTGSGPRIYLMTQSLGSGGATGTRTATGTATTSRCVSAAFVEGDLTLGVTGSLTATLAALTLAATATASIAGTLAQTLAALTLAAEGTVEEVAVAGSLDVTLDALTLDATGSLPITGSADVTLDSLSLQAQAWSVLVIVSMGTVRGATLRGDVLGARAAGNVISPRATGTVFGIPSFVPETIEGPAPARMGSLTATLALLALSAEGVVQVVGELSATLAALSLEAAGEVGGGAWTLMPRR